MRDRAHGTGLVIFGDRAVELAAFIEGALPHGAAVEIFDALALKLALGIMHQLAGRAVGSEDRCDAMRLAIDIERGRGQPPERVIVVHRPLQHAAQMLHLGRGHAIGIERRRPLEHTGEVMLACGDPPGGIILDHRSVQLAVDEMHLARQSAIRAELLEFPVQHAVAETGALDRSVAARSLHDAVERRRFLLAHELILTMPPWPVSAPPPSTVPLAEPWSVNCVPAWRPSEVPDWTLIAVPDFKVR